MPESRLTLTNDDLRGEIGAFLGYGRGTPFGETAWTTIQENDILATLKSGLGFVYRPQPLVPGGPVHNWSFLRPWATVVIPEGVNSANLPDDFGGFEGPIIIQGDSPNRYIPIETVNQGIIEARIAAQPSTTGAPLMACEAILKDTTPERSNRSQIMVWPTTDQEYSLRVDYYYQPDVLDGVFRFPPGGSSHPELFKAAVLAAAELFKDNERGPMWAHFIDRLAAAIGHDRKRKGQRLSYNGDWTEVSGDIRDNRDYNRRFGWGRPLLVNGTEYE